MLALDRTSRLGLWESVWQIVEGYLADVNSLPVSPEMNPETVRTFLNQFTFETPLKPVVAAKLAAEGMRRWQVHTPHPGYFGLFNPAPTTMGIAADTLVAAFNPQMAAWSHNPFAAEAERYVIRALGAKFGYAETDGTFCSGGMEANHTGVLCALTARFPEFPDGGVRALPACPVFYASAESHHSLLKAARMVGLGSRSLRLIPVDADLKMRIDLLREAIAADRAAGLAPFMIGATAGTTNAGVVDPLTELAEVAESEGLWMHTDAAWGGAAVLVPELRTALNGIERSHSITFDAHKWLSVPMGAGIFLTRNTNILRTTFQIATAYMPKDAAAFDVDDPHQHSMQWSRRFVGLKVLLSLAVAGWDGYAEALRHQTAMGDLLRARLKEEGWELVNQTPLPVVCFAERGGDADRQRAIASAVIASGAAWISPTVTGGRTVLRACVTNYATQARDVETLVQALASARRSTS